MIKLVCDFCRNEIPIMNGNPDIRVYEDRDFIKYEIRKVDKYNESTRLDVCGDCLTRIEGFLESLTVTDSEYQRQDCMKRMNKILEPSRPHIEQPR